MKPWIDRNILIAQATDFIRRNGAFLNKHAKRISSLVEVAVYNSVTSYYQSKGFKLSVHNLGPKRSFKFKLSSNGIEKNFSHFSATNPITNEVVRILHNTKLQSAHHKHLYYTPDVAVTTAEGVATVKLKSGKKHSYIPNDHLLTFVEVKHLPPFPEALFSFSGLVLEFMPGFINGEYTVEPTAIHLTPSIVFTGKPSEHVDVIKSSLASRYGINIISSTEKTHGRVADFDSLLKYKPAKVGLGKNVGLKGES